MITFSIVVPGVSLYKRTYLSVPQAKLEKIRLLAIVKKKVVPKLLN